jgi:hypothetical protein
MDAPNVHWAQLSLKQVTSKSSAAILNPDIYVIFGNEKHIWLLQPVGRLIIPVRFTVRNF